MARGVTIEAVHAHRTPDPALAPPAAAAAPSGNGGGAGKRVLVSMVAPVFCEEQVLPEFHRRAKAALAALGTDVEHELVLVNDGSTDGTGDLLDRLAVDDPNVRVVHLSRNFGHQAALTAGLDHARGDAVILIDADLQDPPELAAEMVRRWREGCKVVYAVRRRRHGETAFKRMTAGLYYGLLSRLSDVRIPPNSGDFRLLDRAVVEAVTSLREEGRYLRGLTSWVGFKQCPVEYERDARYAGVTKYPLARMLRLGFDGISSFSDRPLRFSSHVGMLVTIGSLLFALWIIVNKLRDPSTAVSGWASMMVAVLFLGGVQLLAIGILGEYVGRIFRQSKARPLYVVAERRNFTPARPVAADVEAAQSVAERIP
jgi:dolichol-phosphate mannosyltransferase